MLVKPEPHAGARQLFWAEPFLDFESILPFPLAHQPLLITSLVDMAIHDSLLKVLITDVFHFVQSPSLLRRGVIRSG